MSDASASPAVPRPLRPTKSVVQEVLFVYLALCLATFVLTLLRAVPLLTDYVHLGVGALFLLTAMRLAQREPGGYDRFGIRLGGLLSPHADDERDPGPLGLYDLARTIRAGLPSASKETFIALGLAAVIFPPFAIGFHWYHGAAHPFRWNPPDELASFVAAQFVVVALTEEAFFRGYVQTRLGDVWKPRRFLGALVHPATLLVQAALFAAVHVIATPNPAQLATFFPGLVFGWLRGWRGGIGAALVFHAVCNVFSEFLVRGWLR